MKKIYGFLIFLSMIFSIPVFSYCEVKDDAGEVIKLTKPAKRVISLAPDMTENLFAIGGGEQVLGVISGSDYPSAVKALPKVGSYRGLDLERIFTLQPDLILTWGNLFQRELALLKKNNIPIYVAKPHGLEDIPRLMRNLGCLLGKEKKANENALDFLHELSQLRKRYHSAQVVSVFYQLGSYSLMTINKDSWVNEVIKLCGGKNIFAEAKFIAPVVDMEAVIAANPHVILNSEESEDWKKRWLHLPQMTAVKNQALFTIKPDYLHRAGPRLLKGIEEVCRYLQTARSVSS